MEVYLQEEKAELKKQHKQEVEAFDQEIEQLRQEKHKQKREAQETQEKMVEEHALAIYEMKQNHDQEVLQANRYIEQLQTEIEQNRDEVKHLQHKEEKLHKQKEGAWHEQNALQQTQYQQVMKEEKEQYKEELAKLVAAHQQEIKRMENEVRAWQRVSKEKDAKIFELGQQQFSETEGLLPLNVAEMARNISCLIGNEDFPLAASQPLTPPDCTAALQALGVEPTAGLKPQSYLFLIIPFHTSVNSQVLDCTGPPPQREEGDGQSGAAHPAVYEAKQVDLVAHLPDTSHQDNLDGGTQEAAAQITKDEKIQRMQRIVNSYERLQTDTQNKVVKLEKQLEEEEEKRKEHEKMMAHISEPRAERPSTHKVTPDLEVHQQDFTTAKKNDDALFSAETARLQAQIADLQIELKRSDEEVEQQALEITRKEGELNEMRERLHEQETKREKSEKMFELLEKVTKQTPSPKATHDLDIYFDQLIKMTEELTELKAEKEKQKKELDQLGKLVKRAEDMEKVNVAAVTELSQREQEIKLLQKEVHVQQMSMPTEVTEGEATHMAEEVKGKTDPVRERSGTMMSSEAEVESLRKELQEKEKAMQNLVMLVHSLEPTLQEKHKLSRELRREREKHTQEKKTLVDHSKKQSEAVRDLKHKLEEGEHVPQQPTEIERLRVELQQAKASKVAAALRAEKGKSELEQVQNELKAQVEALSRQLHDTNQKYLRVKSRADLCHSLTEQVAVMKRDSVKLQEENQLLKLEAEQYEQDFQEERRDRERAVDSLEEERTKNAENIQVMTGELERLKKKVKDTSKEVARLGVESRKKDELLLESQCESAAFKRDAERLQEEVKAKTAQVKQYKKQIDSLQQERSTGQQQQKETPQHQQPLTEEDSEVIEKLQVEMVEYKSKLEETEKELSTLKKTMDQKYQKKLEEAEEELHRLQHMNEALTVQMQAMESSQRQVLHTAQVKLAEAEEQQQGMASQLRELKGWRRREDDFSKAFQEEFEAHKKWMNKCQLLQKKLDSTLDQLDGLSQQKQVLTQALQEHGIELPFQEMEVVPRGNDERAQVYTDQFPGGVQQPLITVSQKPISSPGIFSQQTDTKHYLPPHSDVEAQHQKHIQQQQQQQKWQQQQLQQKQDQLHQEAVETRGPDQKLVGTSKAQEVEGQPKAPQSTAQPVLRAPKTVVGILPKGLQYKKAPPSSSIPHGSEYLRVTVSQKPISSPRIFSQQTDTKHYLPPHSDAEAQHKKHIQQQKQQQQQEWQQQQLQQTQGQLLQEAVETRGPDQKLAGTNCKGFLQGLSQQKQQALKDGGIELPFQESEVQRYEHDVEEERPDKKGAIQCLNEDPEITKQPLHEREASLEGDGVRLEVKSQESGLKLPTPLAPAPTPQQMSHSNSTITTQADGIDILTQKEVAELRTQVKDLMSKLKMWEDKLDSTKTDASLSVHNSTQQNNEVEDHSCGDIDLKG